MPLQVIWTQSALNDLSEILEEDYLDADGEYPLEKKAFYLASLLETNPRMGEVFRPLGKPYRQLVVNVGFRLVYIIGESQVFIMRLVPTRKEFTRAWKERERQRLQ